MLNKAKIYNKWSRTEISVQKKYKEGTKHDESSSGQLGPTKK